MNYSSGVSQYQSVDVECKVAGSSPHMLVAMLFDGILKNLSIASGAIERNDTELKGKRISAAIEIIDNLRAGLDVSKGGELAENLLSLYDYMERRLIESNLKSSNPILVEVSSLVGEIKEGWDAIPLDYRR